MKCENIPNYRVSIKEHRDSLLKKGQPNTIFECRKLVNSFVPSSGTN